MFSRLIDRPTVDAVVIADRVLMCATNSYATKATERRLAPLYDKS